MTARELINLLQKFNQDKEIVLFDDEPMPYKIGCVVIDSGGNGELSHIVISRVEE